MLVFVGHPAVRCNFPEGHAEPHNLQEPVETGVQICGRYLAKPFPCIKPKGHDGKHESSAGQIW